MSVVEMREKSKPQAPEPDEMKAFLIVVRQALLMIVGYIERRYELKR